MTPSTDSPHHASRFPGAVDRSARWPLVIVLAVSGTIIVCRASPIGPDLLYVIIGIPALLLFLTIAAIPATIAAVTAARAGTWRRAVSCALLPAVVLANVPGPFAFVHACNVIGNLIHFEIVRYHYLSVIKLLPDIGQPKLVVFNWGGMIWASSGVVYDESDEIALPREKQSPSWIARASTTELSCGKYSIVPIGGHFYLADFPC